jgi:hypothetical protein
MLVAPEPALAPAIAAFGALAVLAVVGVLYVGRAELSADERRTLTWLGAAALLSPVLLVGTTVSGRVLPFVLVGASALVGHALALAWHALRRGSDRKRWFLLVPVGLLGLFHLVFSPLIRVVVAAQFAKFAKVSHQLAQQADLSGCEGVGFAYLLSASDPTLSIYAEPAIAFYTPAKSPQRMRALSLAPHEQELERVAPNAFELRTLGLPRRTNDFERIYRPRNAPLRVGDHFQAEELSVKVLETQNGWWTRARFDLGEPLDASSVCLLTWRNGRLEKLPVPPVGGTIAIPHNRGPLGL